MQLQNFTQVATPTYYDRPQIEDLEEEKITLIGFKNLFLSFQQSKRITKDFPIPISVSEKIEFFTIRHLKIPEVTL